MGAPSSSINVFRLSADLSITARNRSRLVPGKRWRLHPPLLCLYLDKLSTFCPKDARHGPFGQLEKPMAG